MKRKHSVCAVIMIVAIVGIILSCSNNPTLENKLEETGYVSFGNANSRSLSVMYEMEDFDDLYWFYTATKADRYGQTGQTNGEAPVPAKANGKGIGDGTVGPFSMGDWDFNLYAYKDAGKTIKVYEGKTPSRVNIIARDTKNVSVAVSPFGTTGLLKINNAYFNWDSASGGDLPVIHLTMDKNKSDETTDQSFDIVPVANENGDITFALNQTIPVGFYYCRLWATIDTASTPIYETEEFTLRIYGATTTTIYGHITEQTGPSVKFSATKSDNSELAMIAGTGTTTVRVNATPTGDNTTTVDFGNYNVGTSSTTDEDGNVTKVSHALEVAVSSSDTMDTSDENRFIVADGMDVVAALDLTLVKTTVVENSEGIELSKTTEPVTEFGDGNEVIITTYIAKNLSDVKVLYNNGTANPETITLVSYDPTTGNLVFKVSHFSEYYIIAERTEARIGDKYYKTLEEAIEAATDGATITILRGANVTLESGIANEGDNSRDITFIGNGTQTVDVVTEAANAEGGKLNYQRGSTFTFENLTIQAGEGSYDGIVCNELTFNNCTIKGKLTLFGKATFINCTFENTMADQYSIWTWGGTDVKFDRCTFNTNGKAILLYGSAPTNLVVNNCTFNDRNNGTAGKAAIEIGNDYNATYTLTVNNATVNGFAAGKNTGSRLWANKNSMGPAHLTITIDGTVGFEQGVAISGIAGVADFYNTIQDAYEAVKAMLLANSGLGEESLNGEAFNAFFTDGGKITWTIYGNHEVTDTRMFSFGRAANRFGEGRQITEINIVGGNSSASLDLSAVNGTFALPYNWWNVEDSVNTTLKCRNITFNGIKYMPSATYQCTLYPTTYEFDGCTFNGELYSYQNFDVDMTIKNCTFNAPANTQYAFMSQGNGGTITLDNNVFNNYTRGINLQRATADFIVTNNTIVSTCSESDRGAIQLTDGKSFVVTGNKVDVDAGNAFWFHNAATNANVTYTISGNDIKAPYIGYSGVTTFDVNTKITSSGNTFNSTDTTKCMKKDATVAEATNLTAIH